MSQRGRTVALCLSVVLFGATLSPSARGQSRDLLSRPLIGPVVEYDFGAPLVLDRLPGLVNVFRASGSGRSESHTLGCGVGYVSPDLFGRQLGLALLSTLAITASSFQSDPFGATLVDTVTGELRLSANRFALQSTSGLVRLGAELTLFAGERGTIGAGVWGAYRFALQASEVEEILAPDTAAFPDGHRSRIVAAGSSVGSGATRFGLSASAGMRIPLSDFVVVHPTLTAAVDIPALVDGLGSRSWSGGLRVGLLFPFKSRAEPMAGRGRIPGLQLDLFALEDSSRSQIGHLRPIEISRRRIVPLLPAIFFDDPAVELPSRFRTMTRAGADTFSVADLASEDPLHLVRRSLDVIGWRMRLATDARLTLVGRDGGGDDRQSMSRGESIRTYLVDVWRIAPDRISIRSERPDRDGRSVVLLRSSLPALVEDPIEIEWIERKFEAPEIGMERVIPRAGGLRSWEIQLSRLNQPLAEFKGTDFPDGREMSGRLVIDSISGAGDEWPIVATLSVENMEGVRDTAHDELPLVSLQVARDSVDGQIIDGVAGTLGGDLTQLSIPTESQLAGTVRGGVQRPDIFVYGGRNRDPNRVATIASMLFAQAVSFRLEPVSLRILPSPAYPWKLDNTPEAELLATAIAFQILPTGMSAFP